ncbi:hypothetical protein [Mesorhizobium sp. L-8-3]|uniref:hypothetical protein n=1 Tax=Mesorhizobium sp. L-8-3 TaxID=2744522 RepID=UPI00192571D9
MSDDEIAAFRRGATLKTGFTVAGSGEPFSLSSSLDGFSAANKRLGQLSSGPDSKQPPK